jgi:hypothetical protein
MAKGRTPFKDINSVMRYYQAQLNNENPSLGLGVRWNLEPCGVTTIHELLQANPESRPTAKDVFEGRWLKGVE